MREQLQISESPSISVLISYVYTRCSTETSVERVTGDAMAESRTSSPDEAATEEREELLATKLNIPQLRPDQLRRSRLIDRLNQGMAQKLIMVCTPAGAIRTSMRRTRKARSSSRFRRSPPVTSSLHLLVLQGGRPARRCRACIARHRRVRVCSSAAAAYSSRGGTLTHPKQLGALSTARQ
jgi:hypothetical protein